MRVVVVNAEGGQQDGAALASWLDARKPKGSPLGGLVCEADGPHLASDRVVNAITSLNPAFCVYHGEKDHGAREVAVVTRGARYRVTSHETRRLTRGSGWDGATQDRWAEITKGILNRTHKLALVSVHAPTKRQSRILKPLAAILAELRAEGYEVVIGGDMNRTDGRFSPLRRWAKRHGLTHFADHVMWIFATEGVEMTHEKAIPLAGDISDHPTALSVHLRIPRRKRA